MSLEDEMVQLFEGVMSELGEEYASLEISRGALESESPGAPEFGLSMKPTNPDAAPIHVVIFGDTDVVVTVGLATVFEFDGCVNPTKRTQCLSEIEDVCRAVVNGSFEETVWFRRPKAGETLKETLKNVNANRARLKIRGTIIRKGGNLRWGTRREFDYAPYKPIARA